MDRAGKNRKGPTTLDCAQGKGTGILTIETIINSDGYIIEIDKESLYTTITGILNSSKQQQDKLFNCIKEKYKVTRATQKNTPNQRYLVDLDFKN